MRFLRSITLTALLGIFVVASTAFAQEPIHVGFLWHMHQPTYRPGETILETDQSGAFSFSVTDVHNSRLGPYTAWPRNAIQSGLGLPHLGAQVSFSGSLIRNLDTLESVGAGGGQWNNWEGAYRQAANWQTSEGNRRLDLVNFGFNHPLMPLLDTRDIQMQIKLQKHQHTQTWGSSVPFSKGIFPPETAFSTRIIPALVAEGIEWSIVDSIHLERATQNYPHTNASNLYAPNRADQINADITADGGQWVQLNNLWAPSRVAAPFAYRPHNVQHVDPATGQISKIVAVPAARYEGNEDGRGGFGALQYEQVMEQYRQFNTDPNHPMFVLLHHDGDNFGGGSEGYYHGNFQNMVNWASNTPNYDVSTVQDYLDRFPVNPNEVVHIENGSWAGADNGDPEFKKWLGDPDPVTGWSPDRNSWAVLTAAKNHVFTADDLSPATNLENIINGTGTSTERAWHTLLQAQASDHWYWDGTEVWDSNVTLGSNDAVAHADVVINAAGGTESTPPSVFIPQRESYNPGGLEFGATAEPSDFEVWTYAYDVSGLDQVTLHYRVDADGFNPLDSIQNETYAGGSEVGEWMSLTMNASDVAPPPGILNPTYRAERYSNMITGIEDALVDYYVEAIDTLGNRERTDIQHVYVGSSIVAGDERVTLLPEMPVAGEMVSLTYDPSGSVLDGASEVYLHYGFNDWQTDAIDTLMSWNAADSLWEASVPILGTASAFDFVFNNGAGVWDNNNGQDWHYAVTGGEPGIEFVMDGQLDAEAEVLVTVDGRSLHGKLDGDRLYLATDDAGEGADIFIYLSDDPSSLSEANWAKSGQIGSWDAFLADENDNDFNGWFDATGLSATGANGGVLEGVIDLAQLFGELPEEIFLAVAAYESGDGGALLWNLQLPSSLNNDGNLDGSEYLRFAITVVPGDYDGDGTVGEEDYLLWRSTLGSTSNLAADGNGDGVVDAADYTVWRSHFGQTAAAIAMVASVPEPSGGILLVLASVISLCRRYGYSN